MFSGAMLYRLLFRSGESTHKKVRAYLSKLFRQAGFKVPG
jgi:hypothetical protein